MAGNVVENVWGEKKKTDMFLNDPVLPQILAS